MVSIYVLGVCVAVLLLGVIVVALAAPKVRYLRRRKALQQQLERYQQSGRALVRYVMLNRGCTEEVAYQRLATFVKEHVPLDDQSSIERILAQDRLSLLETVQNILIHDPDAIDKI